MEITINRDIVMLSVAHELNEAIHQLPSIAIQQLLNEWPHLNGACMRLARFTAGLRMPAADGASLLVRALEESSEAVAAANEKGDDTLAAFAHTVSTKIQEALQFTVSMSVRGSWHPWNPVEGYLLDELKRTSARSLRVLAVDHPLRKSPHSRIIIASRVFSLNDLVRAGVVDAEAVKSAA